MPNRTGHIVFHDASLAVWEEPGTGNVTAEYRRGFKREVFARIVQQLNRLGWACEVPADMVERYSLDFARDHRYCRKGDLQAELRLSGRCIELQMFQDVANVENRNGGRCDFDKERRMPYLLRLEMERTRRRIRDYLCAVFDGYEFKPAKAQCRPAGADALAWVQENVRSCWHYKPALGRRDGEDRPYNNQSADGARVEHGARVWTTDYRGRIVTGTAFYNINNMWWVITGRHAVLNKASFDIFMQQPDDLRRKRNGRQRERRLQDELDKAIKAMRFERAAVLRDLLFPPKSADAPERLAA